MVGITISMPADAELRASALKWQEMIEPLLIDKWPPGLMALSAPTTFIEFPMQLADEWWGTNEHLPWSDCAKDFANQIDDACNWSFKFFRLNSRSPKDSPWPLEVPISNSGRTILSVMRGSERMLDDLCRFRRADVKPMLCLRDVLYGCEPSTELRVFIQDGNIKAVAEYGHEPVLRWPKERDADLRDRVERYVQEVAGRHLPIQTIVLDLMIDRDGFKVIEVNPFWMSDPVGAQSYDAIVGGIPLIARH